MGRSWPLQAEKLRALQNLVNEQVQVGGIALSTRPWNSSVLVIQKRSAKWHLLHDLRKINAVMEDMVALQPGLPLPTMIPSNQLLKIIELKDCFSQFLCTQRTHQNLPFHCPV